MLPATLQFLVVMIASAINDSLQRKLDYVEEERRILWEEVEALTGGKKISFTAQQRRHLAEAGKLLTPEERQSILGPNPRIPALARHLRLAWSWAHCPDVRQLAYARG